MQKEITNRSPGSILSKTFFLQQQKRIEKTIIFFIKFQSENMKMAWNKSFFDILHDLQFFQMWCHYSYGIILSNVMVWHYK